MKWFFLIIMVFLILVSSVFGQGKADVLSDALDSIGFSRSDLGYQPKGYWNRFPGSISYKLKSFDVIDLNIRVIIAYSVSTGVNIVSFSIVIVLSPILKTKLPSFRL